LLHCKIGVEVKMRVRLGLAVTAALTMLAAAPAPSTIEAEWKAGIADANKDWATIPHAILKIQDAAYLGEGQSATLVGTKGKPTSSSSPSASPAAR
jgi:hypothetical protein